MLNLARHKATKVLRSGMLLGLTDQILSSASNVLVMLAVARVSSISLFGLLAVYMAVVSTGMAISRSCFGTPLMLKSSASREDVRRETSNALVGSLAISLAVAGTLVVVGYLAGNVSLAFPLMCGIIGILWQDIHRHSALARNQIATALTWDGCWTLCSVLLLAVTVLVPSVDPLLILWGSTASAFLSFLGMSLWSGTWPRVVRFKRWWQESMYERLRYGGEASVGTFATLGVTAITVIAVGTAGSAALRGAGTVLGPLSLVMSAIPLAIIPTVVRAGGSTRDTWILLRRIALPLSIFSLGVGITGALIPTSAGESLLGQSWVVVSPLLAITGAEYAALAWLSSIYTALRAHNQSRQLLRGRILYALIMVVSATFAALAIGTALSIAAALAVSAAISVVILAKSVSTDPDNA